MQVKQHELAELFGVTARTIRDWHAQGLADCRDPQTGSYELADAIAWLVERAAEDAGRWAGSVHEEYAQARARNQLAQALLREDELKVSRGELIRMEDVLSMVRKPLDAVDAQLRTAARRHSNEWAGKLGVSQAEAMAMIGEIIEQVRADVREKFEEAGSHAA